MMNKRFYTRVVLLVIAFTCLFGFSGCGALSTLDEKLKENKKSSDDKYWTERNVPPVELSLDITCPGKVENFDTDIRVSRCVYKYLEDGDKTQLMKMFAKSVIDSDSDLGDELDELIKYYQSLDVTGFEMETNSLYKVHRRETSESIMEYTYHTNFVYNDERYVLDIMFVRESTKNDDLLGVHGIRLRNRDTNEAVIVNTINTDI